MATDESHGHHWEANSLSQLVLVVLLILDIFNFFVSHSRYKNPVAEGE